MVLGGALPLRLRQRVVAESELLTLRNRSDGDEVERGIDGAVGHTGVVDEAGARSGNQPAIVLHLNHIANFRLGHLGPGHNGPFKTPYECVDEVLSDGDNFGELALLRDIPREKVSLRTSPVQAFDQYPFRGPANAEELAMYNVKAYAVRHNKTIEVTISGSLPDSCHEAFVVDVYPGGKRVYVKDPEAAQVFIEETSKAGKGVCLMMLVPWIRTVSIQDSTHDSVEVFVNEHEVIQVPVSKASDKFIVIALTGTNTGCSIIPADALYPAIYTRAFGPDTFEKCLDYKTRKCGSTLG